MATPEYHDPAQTVPHTHNTSPQHRVVTNLDPALETAHEHHHRHLHHDAFAEKGREDEVIYSKGTTFERSTIPAESPQDHELHRRHHPEKGTVDVGDAEKGLSLVQSEEEDPQTHTFSRFYARYRIFFHLFIWLLFTGYVVSSCFARPTSQMRSSVWPGIHLVIPRSSVLSRRYDKGRRPMVERLF